MSEIPKEYFTTPISEWQLNLVTFYVVAHLAGHAYAAVRNNGGIVSILRSIWFGSATTSENENKKPDCTNPNTGNH